MNNLINHVSPETSDRLKAAGFPQPVPEAGQVWYDDLNRPVCVRVAFAEYVAFSIFGSLENMSADNEFVKNHCIFAPTATDILRELGDDFCLFTSTMKSVIYWCCNESSGVFDDKERYCTPTGITNPAEAAALAWISLHENPAQK
jgi:hypothetical protein